MSTAAGSNSPALSSPSHSSISSWPSVHWIGEERSKVHISPSSAAVLRRTSALAGHASGGKRHGAQRGAPARRAPRGPSRLRRRRWSVYVRVSSRMGGLIGRLSSCRRWRPRQKGGTGRGSQRTWDESQTLEFQRTPPGAPWKRAFAPGLDLRRADVRHLPGEDALALSPTSTRGHSSPGKRAAIARTTRASRERPDDEVDAWCFRISGLRVLARIAPIQPPRSTVVPVRPLKNPRPPSAPQPTRVLARLIRTPTAATAGRGRDVP